MTAGIYAIIGPNNCRFIGQSVNILSRLMMHFKKLDHKTHSCTALQHDYDKHGYSAFRVEVLAEVIRDPRDLYMLEQHFMDKTACLYNSAKKAYRRCARYPDDMVTPALERAFNVGLERGAFIAMQNELAKAQQAFNAARSAKLMDTFNVAVSALDNTLQHGDVKYVAADQRQALEDMIRCFSSGETIYGMEKPSPFIETLYRMQDTAGAITPHKNAWLATIVDFDLWDHMRNHFCTRFNATVYCPMEEYKRVSATHEDRPPTLKSAFGPYIFILEDPHNTINFEWIREKNVPLNFLFGGKTLKLTSGMVESIMDREDHGDFISSQKNRDYALNRAKLEHIPPNATFDRLEEPFVYLKHKGVEYKVDSYAFLTRYEKSG